MKDVFEDKNWFIQIYPDGIVIDPKDINQYRYFSKSDKSINLLMEAVEEWKKIFLNDNIF